MCTVVGGDRPARLGPAGDGPDGLGDCTRGLVVHGQGGDGTEDHAHHGDGGAGGGAGGRCSGGGGGRDGCGLGGNLGGARRREDVRAVGVAHRGARLGQHDAGWRASQGRDDSLG